MEDRVIIPRKAVKMDSWVKARLTQSMRDKLDELTSDYDVDESELLRRLIVYAHKRRPVLAAEAITPGKIAAQPSVTA